MEYQHKWECQRCGGLFTEGELNNKLVCPRCGCEKLYPAIQLSFPLSKESVLVKNPNISH